MCIFLMRGSLPWQSIKTKDRKEKHKLLYKEKTNTDLQNLCSSLPEEFVTYLSSVRSLEYDEEPKYLEYVQLFKNMLKNNPNPVLDWDNKKEVAEL